MAQERAGLTRRAALLLPLAATGCETLDRWFGDKKVPLAGTRLDVGKPARGLTVDNPAGRAVLVPPQTANASWPQSGLGPAHVQGNPALGARLATAWTAKIGAPSGYRRRITASPVVADGRVYAMDSAAVVSAYDQRNGARLWQTATALPDDDSTNIGGGIAVDGDTLYAGTGLAALLALDAATGKLRWRQKLPAPARGAPTIAEDHIYLATLDEQVLALAKADGSRQWAHQGGEAQTSVLGLPSPAYADGLVVAGFGSGDLACLRALSGSVSWSDGLASRGGRAGLADFTAITGLPVVADGRVFAVGLGGLFVSLDLRTGRRLWEREVASVQTPWLAGDWLYVLTPDQTLGAVNRADGAVAWVQQLPQFRDEKTKDGLLHWIGPTLAGDRLIVLGSGKEMLHIAAQSGAILLRQDIEGVAIVPPVVAGGMLFAVMEDATLVALR